MCSHLATHPSRCGAIGDYAYLCGHVSLHHWEVLQEESCLGLRPIAALDETFLNPHCILSCRARLLFPFQRGLTSMQQSTLFHNFIFISLHNFIHGLPVLFVEQYPPANVCQGAGCVVSTLTAPWAVSCFRKSLSQGVFWETASKLFAVSEVC